MPLSKPASRKLVHTRRIECAGYEREDGLWDIEARLTDVKSVPHARQHGGRERQPGEPIHDMWIRVTIDLDMRVHEVQARTDEGPYPGCGEIAPNFGLLAGLTIGPGWRRSVAERVGGVKGCTHLVELLGPLGTTAFQATNRARHARQAGKPLQRPYQLNACHIYREDSPAVKERWPEFYTGPR